MMIIKINFQRTHALLLIAFSVALASCVSVPKNAQTLPINVCATQASMVNPAIGSGVGGTGIVASGSGIGGTGAPLVQSDPGGIGGTGILAAKPAFGEGGMGGTGIVGVITGFASICVNGLEVEYDATTPVWDNGQRSSARRLEVGQVVSITVAESGNQIKARSIGTVHAVVGPVAAFDLGKGTLQVLGQKMEVKDVQKLAKLQLGQWVRVSGLRLANGEIAASSVNVLPAQSTKIAQVRGPYSAVQGAIFKVGETLASSSAIAMPDLLAEGREMWVSGEWNGRVLQVRQVVVDPTRAGLGRVEKVVLEGYIHKLNQRELNIGYEALELTEQLQIVGGSQAELAVNRRIQVTGRVGSDQKIRIDQIEFSNINGGGVGNTNNSDSSGKSSVPTTGSSSNSGSSSSGSGGSGSGSGGSGSGSGGSGSGSGGSGSGSGGSGSGSGGSGSGSGGSGSGSGGSG